MTSSRPGFARLSALGLGLGLMAPALAPAQFTRAPIVSPTAPNPADVNRLAHNLADRVRLLAEDVGRNFGNHPATGQIVADAQEMATSVDEFADGLQAPGNPAYQAGQSFGGIDANWQYLRNQITRTGVNAAPVNQAVVRVDEMVVAIRQQLGGNPPPPSYGAPGPAPVGVADTQRLANALVSRAQILQATIQGNINNDPNAAAAANDAGQLVAAADQFHDAINPAQPIDVAARAFAPVDALADRVEAYANTPGMAPGVVQAWQSFAQVEVLLHQNLGITASQPAVPVSLVVNGPGPGPMAGLAQQLFDRTNTYIATFSTTARNEHEGFAALGDAQRLLGAVDQFRQAANTPGQNPASLAYAFQDVDILWQRLARRAARIARGRNGPYIQQVRAIGETCEQIHRVLGMAGPNPLQAYPVNGAFAAPGIRIGR